jgi:hypothetical protein
VDRRPGKPLGERIIVTGRVLDREEEHDIDGGVPRSYDHDLDNHRLVCEIRKRGADGGELKVVLSGEHAYSVHRTARGENVVRLTYEDRNLSSTMSSSSGRTSSSSSQVSSSFSSQTLSSNSNTLATSDAARGKEL